MIHLDEGTIHAWLDGALDARRAADVQAHVDQCAACAANVAEARGLIAASSRILTALDDVPAGVTPKRAPPAPVRRWATSAWMTGIAAALVLVALWRTTGVEKPQSMADFAVPKLDSLVVVAAPIAPALAPPEAPPLPAVTQPSPTAQSAAAGGAPAEVGAVRGAVGAGVTAFGPTDERRARSSDRQAGMPAVALTEAASESSRLQRRLEAPQRIDTRLDEVASAPAAKDAVADAVSWSGCYRLNVAMAKMASEAVAPAANVAQARGKRAALASGAPAAAPARAAEKSSLAGTDALPLVRLDTIAARAGQAGLAVRPGAQRSDSTIGVWRELSADSASVELPARGVFAIAKRDRVACPQ